MIVPIPKEAILPEIEESIKKNIEKEMKKTGFNLKIKILKIDWTADGLEVHVRNENA